MNKRLYLDVIVTGVLVLTACAKKVSEPKGAPKKRSVTLLYAQRDLPRGATLTKEQVGFRKVAEEAVAPGLLTKAHLTEVLGKRVELPLTQGSPLIKGMFVVREQKPVVVRPGGRLYTLTLKGPSLPLVIRRGDHVDVVAAYTEGADDNRQVIAKTIIENVVVLASHERCLQAAGCSSTVSLLLLPEEAEKVTLAETIGQVRLTVRNREDRSLIKLNRTTTATSLSGGAPVMERRKDLPPKAKALPRAPKPEQATPAKRLKIQVR